MITVFTPAYNRAHLLRRLFKSLCMQTYSDFEWIIVDDGSQDNTEKIVKEFVDTQLIKIIYFKQINKGKHFAINKGVREANGDLFFIVDSDDYLVNTALERVAFHYDQIVDDETIGGVCGLKIYPSGIKVGNEGEFSILDCSSLDFRFKYKMKGDMAEVFRTEVLRKYPFPEIANEKFCPEALVWNRIAANYKLRYFYEKLYVCEYLQDGLTAKIIRIRMNSPIASILFYSEQMRYRIPFIQKIKTAINYWRFAFCLHNNNFFYLKKYHIDVAYFPLFFIGLFMHLKDIING